MQQMAKSEFSKKTIIYDIPISKKQIQRENFQPLYGAILDASFAYVFFYAQILTFVPVNLYEPFVFLGAHIFIVEPVYYWYHRILHFKSLYKHHHQYHHLSTTTTPNTSFTFTILERLSYTILFSIPITTALLLNVLSIYGFVIYLLIFDIINALGHLNFEVFGKGFANSKLRYFIYSASYHSQHHSKFRKNYALFMPIYDHIFNTYEPSSDEIFKSALAHHPLHKITESPK